MYVRERDEEVPGGECIYPKDGVKLEPVGSPRVGYNKMDG